MIIQPKPPGDIPSEVLTQGEADALYLKLAGGNMTGGINWGLTAHEGHTNPDDLTQLWRWYDGKEDFGMSVTTGRLNYVTTHPDNWHYFRVDSVDIARFSKFGLEVLGALEVIAPTLTVRGQDSDERYWLRTETPIDTETSVTIGDVKSAFLPNDHGGWVRLDGRLVSTLNADQQESAALLGFETFIPDATGSVLMQRGTLGEVTGSMSKTLTQDNLPDVTLTSSSDGDHYHTVMAVTNENGNCGFSEMLAPNAYPASKVWNRQAITATGNNQNIPIVGRCMDGSGPHSHTVPLGGASTPLDITPKALAVNQFVYLGA
jgi:hypothetical protein